ncbi:MAG: glycosyltransferase [Zymomonas sp.]|nr:MAG: glycosyltransferase [Zymomonas sp.]
MVDRAVLDASTAGRRRGFPRFVVFPSRYEGYGLSLVEAMAMGKACLSGVAGALTEVGGSAPLYIDPVDLLAWVTALSEAFTDDAMIGRLEDRARADYDPVTWDDSADRFYAILNQWSEQKP